MNHGKTRLPADAVRQGISQKRVKNEQVAIFTPFNNKKIKMMCYWICKILHGVNEDALCYELDLMGIAYQRRLELNVYYKDAVFVPTCRDRANLLVKKRVLVENKAMKKITNQDEAQLINYLFHRSRRTPSENPYGKNNAIKSGAIV